MDPAGQSPRPLTVLVVDDEVDTATSLAELLSLHGYAAEVAFDGREALRQVARLAPAVVLLDIWMPGIDGCEVARTIREQSRTGSRPFLVAITGYESPDASPNSVRSLFDLYLVKPVEPALLVGVLERIRRFLSPPEAGPEGGVPDEPHDPIDHRTEGGQRQSFARAVESFLQSSAAPILS